MRVLRIIAAAGLAVLISGATTSIWPMIKAVEVERTYVQGGDDPLRIFVMDITGSPLYRLECHNDHYDDDSEVSFSGDFQCALFSQRGGTSDSWNLLATEEEAEQRSDWNNRGRMLASQLWGECGSYPEFGALRHFRLRGMLITFTFSRAEWIRSPENDQHQLKTFTFRVSIAPDSESQNPTAETVRARRPPSVCGW